MATFAVTVLSIRGIEPIKGADFIELAVVGDYRSIVKKGDFSPGDLVAYIPEASLVPDALLESMGLTGKLSGSKKNRVKAVKLRGCLSQGLCLAARPGWVVDQDVTEELGITKYVPPIPTSMAGQVYTRHGWTLKYDIENFKRHPDVLEKGEQVSFTEKLHGTWTCIGVVPQADADPEYGDVIITSKGLSARGLVFKPDVDQNQHNLYVRVAKSKGIIDTLRTSGLELFDGEPIYVLGETFGAGVQDLGYGAATSQDATLGFRAFDIYVGKPGQGRYLNWGEFYFSCGAFGLEPVPLLYQGPFSREVMLEHTDGRETVSGKAMHIREGIVIKPMKERRDNEIGRVLLKSVSAKYLTRKGEVTEYE